MLDYFENKTAALLAVIILIGGGYIAGRHDGKLVCIEEYESALTKNSEITECDGQGCNLWIQPQTEFIEEHDDPFWIRCDTDYVCTTAPRTEEIRKRDAEAEAELQKLYDLLPAPITN